MDMTTLKAKKRFTLEILALEAVHDMMLFEEKTTLNFVYSPFKT